MDPIVNFLKNVCLPAASRIRHRSALYMLRDGQLYRKGQSFPSLKCLTPAEELKGRRTRNQTKRSERRTRIGKKYSTLREDLKRARPEGEEVNKVNWRLTAASISNKTDKDRLWSGAIHSGNHSGARALAFKALRTGYYWLSYLPCFPCHVLPPILELGLPYIVKHVPHPR